MSIYNITVENILAKEKYKFWLICLLELVQFRNFFLHKGKKEVILNDNLYILIMLLYKAWFSEMVNLI